MVTEALASGLPVVAPEKGGVLDSVIPGKTGVLVPPKDPRAFAAAITSLLSEEGNLLALARGARAHALARSWETVLDKLLHDYQDALGPAAGLQSPTV